MQTEGAYLSPSYSSPRSREATSENSAMRTVAYWLSLMMIFMISWEDMIQIGGLTLARVTGLLVAGFWALTILVTGRFRKPHSFHLVIVIFLLWNFISVFWSLDVNRTAARILTYLQLAGLVLILWDLYVSPAALRAGLQAYVLGAYVAAGSITLNYFGGSELFTGRYTATGFNVNDVGLTVALGLPVAWHLAVSEHHSKMTQVLRLVNYLYLPVAAMAILLTASRGSLIAALPVILFVVASLPRFKMYQRVLIVAPLIGALFALTPLVPQASLDRLATVGSSIAEADLGGRVNIWREGLATFADRPLIGVGSGAFRLAVDSGMSSHNSYLTVLVEVGMIGFILLSIVVGIVVHQAVRHSKWDARFWFTVLFILALGNFVHGWVDRKATWLFLGFVVVSANLSIGQIQARIRAEYPAKFRKSSNVSTV